MNQFQLRMLVSSFLAIVLLSACVAPLRTITVASPTALSAIPSTQSPALDVDAGLKRVETFLDNANKSDVFAGAALVAKDGKIIFSKAWGIADRDKKVANTPNTIFRIGEITIQFTAAAILLLEQEGKLSVQDPICNYLDNCPSAWKPITIHHLLSQTSGIPDYLDLPSSQKFTVQGATPQQIVASFKDEPLAFKVGEQRGYSHSNFVLAGLIIERVSGQLYGDFLKQHIFDPLGMSHSGYGEPADGFALGYGSGFSSTPVSFNVSALYASGACYSTAEDLYRWNEGLYNEKLLNAAQLKKMLTTHIAFGDRYSGQGQGYASCCSNLASTKAQVVVAGMVVSLL